MNNNQKINIMKLLKSVLMLMMIVAMATSCEKEYIPGENEIFMELSYTEEGCFNYIYNESADSAVISTGTTYKFRWNDDYTADVYVYNAKFSVDMPDGINISFEGLKWEMIDGWKKICVNDIVPTSVTENGNQVDVSEYVLDNLTLNVFDRRLLNFTPEYIPVINMSVKKGDVVVVTVQKQVVFSGETKVTGGLDYGYNSAVYKVALDPSTMLATIDLYNVKFAGMMPATDMRFKGIEFKLSNKGYSLNSQALIPVVVEGDVEVPNEKYKITNLKGNGVFATGLNLEFNCKGKYLVQASLGYPLVL